MPLFYLRTSSSWAPAPNGTRKLRIERSDSIRSKGIHFARRKRPMNRLGKLLTALVVSSKRSKSPSPHSSAISSFVNNPGEKLLYVLGMLARHEENCRACVIYAIFLASEGRT
jgi:hypothetical protein